MEFSMTGKLLSQIKHYAPDAEAALKGSVEYPQLHGKVLFWQTKNGCLVLVETEGLPQGQGDCNHPIFALHIHEGSRCAGNIEDPFAETKGHYNPENCEHPAHAGDLPPLFSNHGMAWMAVLTDRFSVRNIIGRTVVIHQHPDDFRTQPSGDSGEKIACGVVRATWN